MRLTIPLLVVGAGFATANPLRVMIATTEVSAFRLGHPATNVGPAVSADVKPTKMRHLCKNMQKAVQNTASRILSAIGISGPSLSVTTPVPEGGISRVQITHHKLVPIPMIEPFMVNAGGKPPHQDVSVMHYGVHKDIKDTHYRGPLLHRVHRALMLLGPWEGRIVAFVLGCGIGVLLRMFWVLTVLAVRAFRSTPEPEEEAIFINEKRGSEATITEENRA
ncbi:hypothetical protein B0F90DRAFT_1741182 [Multifurca ochricompacta]|uniref:Uncharacterized protein n=1 Tax=Multifurca ochricompacta TaxID=376703 RepID=A0AAD4QLP4_9AGAM|nr:hypothetical protein B0F90DRAFT_1741182 [Multifurca ochricompacta]